AWSVPGHRVGAFPGLEGTCGSVWRHAANRRDPRGADGEVIVELDGSLAHVAEREAQRITRDPDQAVERTIQLDDEEHRCRDRERGDEEHADDCRVSWGVETETSEGHREPEDHDAEERAWNRAPALRWAPARLQHVVAARE